MAEDSSSHTNGFFESPGSFGEDSKIEASATVIKKYANRRLYNTGTSTYVTLDDLAAMVRSGADFVVYDARTGEDLTHSVLTQIIVEQESKGSQNLLPIGFLRQLIRFYGNSIERLVPSYLEYSLDTLTREQEKYRQQFANAFGNVAIEAMQEQTRKNLEIFQRALNMFSPFTAFESSKPAPGMEEKKSRSALNTRATAKTGNQADEIADLKSKLASIQTQLDKLAGQNK
jgi:polyhydroxyalkanoate synthesis repressor PhaR